MSVSTVITRGFAIGDIAGVATRGFLGSGAAPATEAVDTHDGGAARHRRRNTQPLPSLEEVRRRLLSRTKRPVEEIERAAEAIEALADRIEEPQQAWRNPVELPSGERPAAVASLLALVLREAQRIDQVVAAAQASARRAALERYQESLRALEAAVRERQELDEAEEADELLQIVASIM